MYLSRLLPSLLSGPAQRLVSNPYAVHQLLCGLFENPAAERVLFRIEAEDDRPPWILFQSKVSPPDFQRLSLKFTDLVAMPETKQYSPVFSIGESLAFRLLARPTKRISNRGEVIDQGKRKALTSDDERLQWFARKSAGCGFEIQECELSLGQFRDYKPDDNARVSNQPSQFDEKLRGTYPTSRFDGVLLVTDPAKLLWAVEHGIGTQKMQGFGLLSVGRARLEDE